MEQQQSDKYLFLDDVRMPYEVGNYIYPVRLRPMYRQKSWKIVRDYEEFVEYIEKNGLPDVVSFDHDLADSHYAPEHLWTDYEKSKEWQDNQIHTEKTGYDCAKWLVDYCIENNINLPDYYCHSMNPVGKDKILNLLNQYEINQTNF